MSKEANMVFNMSVAYQMCTSVLAICMTMFRLSIVAPLTSEFFTSVFYQTALLLQILLYCWSGNEVISTSNEISLAGYEMDWIDSSIEFKKNLLFFIRGTQEPIRLYALQFFTLSLETFIKILRMSWSYFALLQQMNNANK
uniref:GR10 n=1 Tax=Hycleus phaleratus TaxID=1248972 RepID=A0A2U9NJK2_9CUCU|nr:OR3 [Hycleus phaleratus]AWT23373.1 GR10 [Hycleus phaleratus]